MKAIIGKKVGMTQVFDENGYVIDSAYDYNMDEGTTVSGTMKFTNGEYNGKFVNVAFFTNPTLEE